MLPLPPVIPQLGWHASTRLPRDRYVHIGSHDDSVDPVAIGRRVDVHADLTAVTIRRCGRVVAAHDRPWGQHQAIHDPAHLAAAARMRRRTQRDPGPGRDEVQVRALDDYARLLGLDEGVV